VSRVAEAASLTWSPLLECDAYVLSEPHDLATPAVDAEFRTIITSRIRALEEFFAPAAQVPQAVWYRLAADACVASLAKIGVSTPEPSELRHFLTRHPDLIDPLLAIGAGAMLRTRSGDTWAIGLYRDPEVESEYLTLCLRRTSYTDDTLDLVETIGDLAEARLAGRSGWMLVSTDFRPPASH
jgi:hypothetical protein